MTRKEVSGAEEHREPWPRLHSLLPWDEVKKLGEKGNISKRSERLNWIRDGLASAGEPLRRSRGQEMGGDHKGGLRLVPRSGNTYYYS